MENNVNIDQAKLAEKAMLKYLMQVALTQPHSKVTLIQSINAYRAAKVCRRAIRKTNRVFKKMKRETLKKAPADQHEMIIANFNKIIAYYKEEIRMLTDVIREFRCYAYYNRHTLRTLLGMPRSEEEMVDYRTLPFSWF